MSTNAYETDFYGWANEQAALLRAGRVDAADIEHIAQEIESMGKSEKRELISRLTVLLIHLLKWKFQPKGRCSSWETSIKVQRNGLVRHLDDNPSLRPLLPQALADAYQDALLIAAEETKLSESAFPPTCPWSDASVLNPTFWPDA
ncbi:MAG: DUF29 domain-containing protein [Roseiarcus sp.]